MEQGQELRTLSPPAVKFSNSYNKTSHTEEWRHPLYRHQANGLGLHIQWESGWGNLEMGKQMLPRLDLKNKGQVSSVENPVAASHKSIRDSGNGPLPSGTVLFWERCCVKPFCHVEHMYAAFSDLFPITDDLSPNTPPCHSAHKWAE